MVIHQFSFAQKEDRNWCFGFGAGIDFNNLSNPAPFRTLCNNIEANASISDSNGNLLFYLVNAGEFYGPYNILNNNGNIIDNGDSIWANTTITNGIIILPVRNNYYVLYISLLLNGQANCQNASGYCNYLYYSKIKRNNGGDVVLQKNTLLLNEQLEEKIIGIKHADGEGWWVIVKKRQSVGCTNTFYKFLIKEEETLGPFGQDIGVSSCNLSVGWWGEISASKEGTRIALATSTYANNTEHGIVEVFEFDRCSGLMTNPFILENGLFYPYGVEFSPDGNLLYVSEGQEEQTFKIFQYQLSNHFKRLIFTDTASNLTRGQFELAADSKLYFTVAYGAVGGGTNQGAFNYYSQNLSVINYPDSIGTACDFQPYSFYLGDSSNTYAGLPNMPNYNLGPLSIYEASAGEEDTITICTEDTTVKGVLLGIPAISGVTYSWEPSDSLNYNDIAQPFAFPRVSTWYYVTLTDTSIKYSCQSRIDSVFVEVRDCSVGIEETKENQIRIFPNPAKEILKIAMSPQLNIRNITISDISGRTIIQTTQTSIPVSALSSGLYFVKVIFANGQSIVKKVVIE